MKHPRKVIAACCLSAAALVGLVTHEGYDEVAKAPVPGDVCTNGFGTTKNPDGSAVKCGDKTNPVKALNRALNDITKFEGSIKQCITAPLHQYEYDAYVSLAYNIGGYAFCKSTLVKKLNQEDYEGACKEILRFDKFKGEPLRGLTLRRQSEYKQCMGAQ